VSFLHPPASRGLGFPFRGTFPQEPGKLWAVVLAGGEGTRVSALTRGPAGEPIPKQYCAFGTDQPLLRWALRRAEAVVPRSRILVVVVERHRRFWRETFVDLPQENIVVQPLNKGTAPGVLLAALDVVLRRDRDARLLVLPADHHVESEDVLRRAMLAAARAVIRPGAPLVLLGMAGEDADREYGWILPSGGPSVGIRAVLSFVEKPATERSRELAGSGALANSLIFAFRGRTLVRLYRKALPELLRVLVPVVRAGCQEASLREVYDEIPSCDFSRAVLERCSSSLAVLAVPPCGWSDLGTPSRLVRFLGRRGQGHMASAAEVNVS
jgi:mannose-1-phosphate guanylyltransferase